MPSLKILSVYFPRVTEEQNCKGYAGILGQWVMKMVKHNSEIIVQSEGDD